MVSISPPTFPSTSTRSSDTNPHKLTFTSPRFSSLHPPPIKKPSSLPFHSHFLPRISDSPLCRCHNSSSSPDSPSPSPSPSQKGWDSAIQDVVRNVIKRFDEYMNSFKNRPKESDTGSVEDKECEVGEEQDDEIWDWDKWMKHFKEVDEQERIVSILKSQLDHAVNREDYEGAARLKVAIAAAATNDAVGRVISHLNRAIEEECYNDAALIRDYAGAGLVGWWAAISEDANDPYGRIIRITPEHGRYVAKSYSPRQLAMASAGVPLFEIFLTIDKKGEYKQQAVYLKRRGISHDSQTISSSSTIATPSSTLNTLDTIEDKSDMFMNIDDSEDNEDRDDDSDVAEGLSGFQNILRDMIPGVKVKVLKVTAPGKVDRDIISKVIEHIMDEEDEEKDADFETVETDDEAKGESDQEKDVLEMDAGGEIIDGEEQYEVAVQVVGGLVQKLSSSMPSKDLVRVPAVLEKKGRLSFSFSIEKDANTQDFGAKEQVSADKKSKLRGQRSIDHVMFDLAKFVGREKIPLKVLKDINELINLTLSQAQNRQPLTGSTTFNRIELPASSDPLNGLYIGAHGLYTSEVIHLRRRVGQWQEDGGTKEPSSLEFYEYVEALKLTGDPYVPAGQTHAKRLLFSLSGVKLAFGPLFLGCKVAFRAKVGKRNQLPHKGIIPEEFGVIARYKGQGRLAEPGFRNPRWVDGELVILDGKYIKGGPVVGFVYWAPEFHFLVFFNRLRLQE